jgi:hypothetical protein
MTVKLQTNLKKYPAALQKHIADRIRNRQFNEAMVSDWASWMVARPSVPDLIEAPEGWFKRFSSFTVCGEGEFIKTVFTIYSPGTTRPKSINLDEWQPKLSATPAKKLP